MVGKMTNSILETKLEIMAKDIGLEQIMLDNDLDEYEVIKILFENGLLDMSDHFVESDDDQA